MRQSNGQDYLLNFALPNFYFHVATAHDILRHNEVPIGKREYLGFGRECIGTIGGNSPAPTRRSLM